MWGVCFAFTSLVYTSYHCFVSAVSFTLHIYLLSPCTLLLLINSGVLTMSIAFLIIACVFSLIFLRCSFNVFVFPHFSTYSIAFPPFFEYFCRQMGLHYHLIEELGMCSIVFLSFSLCFCRGMR